MGACGEQIKAYENLDISKARCGSPAFPRLGQPQRQNSYFS
jgi:hypothetical protein